MAQAVLVHDDSRFVNDIGSINGVDHFSSSFCTEERKNSGSATDVKNCLAFEEMLVFEDEITVGFSTDSVFEHQLVDF